MITATLIAERASLLRVLANQSKDRGRSHLDPVCPRCCRFQRDCVAIMGNVCGFVSEKRHYPLLRLRNDRHEKRKSVQQLAGEYDTEKSHYSPLYAFPPSFEAPIVTEYRHRLTRDGVRGSALQAAIVDFRQLLDDDPTSARAAVDFGVDDTRQADQSTRYVNLRVSDPKLRLRLFDNFAAADVSATSGNGSAMPPALFAARARNAFSIHFRKNPVSPTLFGRFIDIEWKPKDHLDWINRGSEIGQRLAFEMWLYGYDERLTVHRLPAVLSRDRRFVMCYPDSRSFAEPKRYIACYASQRFMGKPQLITVKERGPSESSLKEDGVFGSQHSGVLGQWQPYAQTILVTDDQFERLAIGMLEFMETNDESVPPKTDEEVAALLRDAVQQRPHCEQCKDELPLDQVTKAIHQSRGRYAARFCKEKRDCQLAYARDRQERSRRKRRVDKLIDREDFSLFDGRASTADWQIALCLRSDSFRSHQKRAGQSFKSRAARAQKAAEDGARLLYKAATSCEPSTSTASLTSLLSSCEVDDERPEGLWRVPISAVLGQNRLTVKINGVAHRLARFGLIPGTLCRARSWNDYDKIVLEEELGKLSVQYTLERLGWALLKRRHIPHNRKADRLSWAINCEACMAIEAGGWVNLRGGRPGFIDVAGWQVILPADQWPLTA